MVVPLTALVRLLSPPTPALAPEYARPPVPPVWDRLTFAFRPLALAVLPLAMPPAPADWPTPRPPPPVPPLALSPA